MGVDFGLLASITRAMGNLDVVSFITTAITKRHFVVYIHIIWRQWLRTDSTKTVLASIKLLYNSRQPWSTTPWCNIFKDLRALYKYPEKLMK